MKLWKKQQSGEQISCGGERFSLPPAEGERAGVRGKHRAPIRRQFVQQRGKTPHPDPLPFRRGEGTESRRAVFSTYAKV